MRLFVAIPLPPPTDQEVKAVLTNLESLRWPVRWVQHDNLHLTLKFFGEVVPDRLDIIAEMLEFAIERVPPISLTITEGRAFPNLGHARVIRLEVEAGAELEVLQDRIERGGERIDFQPEGRPFNPHVTLGRVREGHRLPASAGQHLETISALPAVLASRIVLFESELTPRGPRYVPRHELVLGQ